MNSAFFELWKIPKSLRSSQDDEKLLAFVISQLADPEQFIDLVEDLYDRPKDISYDEIEFKDGRIFTRTSVPHLMDGKPIARIWNFRDITQQKEREKELELQRSLNAHQAKMASIGELAAGVGHEINNPLAISIGYIDNLHKSLLNGNSISIADLVTILEKTQKANQRIANIVKGLRSLSYDQQDVSKPFNVLTAIKGSFELVNEIYKKNGINIQLNQDSFVSSLAMKGDQGKLQQIIMNLISNAKDAVENQKNKDILVKISNDKEYIYIEVKDNGAGIPDSVQKNIFNPFFTTKEINKGTGIGLSLVANFIKEMDGTINFKSSEDGTKFNLSFPIYLSNDLKENDEHYYVDNSLKENHTKKVLIVEDEEDIRAILEEILHGLGYETVSVGNGLEGYEIIKEDTTQFDLVISDIQMPKMTGYELISAVEKLEISRFPKFIFSTGGVNENLEKKLQSFSNVVGFFYKPFNFDDVEKILSRV